MVSARWPIKTAKPTLAELWQTQQQDRLQNESWRDIASTALAALGVGVAARSALGLGSLFQRNLADPPKTRVGPVMVQLPVPVRRKKRKPGLSVKQASLLGEAGTVEELPWHRLLKYTGGLGAFYGGWKLTDWLLARRRKAELEKELETARRDFRSALVQQFPEPIKVGSDDEPIGQMLDRLYDRFIKMAEGGWWDGFVGGAQRMGRQLRSGYLAYAGLAALLTGLAGYEFAKRRGNQALLQKAVQRRQREEFARRPPEVFASPLEVPVRVDEEEDEPIQPLPRMPQLSVPKTGTDKRAAFSPRVLRSLVGRTLNTAGRTKPVGMSIQDVPVSNTPATLLRHAAAHTRWMEAPSGMYARELKVNPLAKHQLKKTYRALGAHQDEFGQRFGSKGRGDMAHLIALLKAWGLQGRYLRTKGVADDVKNDLAWMASGKDKSFLAPQTQKVVNRLPGLGQETPVEVDNLAALQWASRQNRNVPLQYRQLPFKQGASLIPSRLIREFAPVQDRREEFEPEEEQAIAEGESQWWSPLFQTDATPASSMLASPTRQGLLAGVAAGVPGAALGHLLGKQLGDEGGRGAAIGGLGLGSVAALIRGLQQRRYNANLKERMRRLPAGATKRDLDHEASLREALMNRLDHLNATGEGQSIP